MCYGGHYIRGMAASSEKGQMILMSKIKVAAKAPLVNVNFQASNAQSLNDRLTWSVSVPSSVWDIGFCSLRDTNGISSSGISTINSRTKPAVCDLGKRQRH